MNKRINEKKFCAISRIILHVTTRHFRVPGRVVSESSSTANLTQSIYWLLSTLHNIWIDKKIQKWPHGQRCLLCPDHHHDHARRASFLPRILLPSLANPFRLGEAEHRRHPSTPAERRIWRCALSESIYIYIYILVAANSRNDLQARMSISTTTIRSSSSAWRAWSSRATSTSGALCWMSTIAAALSSKSLFSRQHQASPILLVLVLPPTFTATAVMMRSSRRPPST